MDNTSLVNEASRLDPPDCKSWLPGYSSDVNELTHIVLTWVREISNRIISYAYWLIIENKDSYVCFSWTNMRIFPTIGVLDCQPNGHIAHTTHINELGNKMNYL